MTSTEQVFVPRYPHRGAEDNRYRGTAAVLVEKIVEGSAAGYP